MATPGRSFVINLIGNSDSAERAFGKVGQAAGRLKTPMGIAVASITAVFAAVTAAAVKSFSSLLELGNEFNEVSRTIRAGTGAVGEDLAALEQSFRDVASSVPNAFADVATVIAELDTRTDLTGAGLEAMAEQLLTLARLTGGDVQSTTREVTRLFNRFGLSAEDASDMLDLLFRASQASGAEVGQLAADVTKQAAALGGLGLSLEESIALFAMFEREGVRSRTVVSALQTGFLKLTKDATVPLGQALAETFAELQTLDREAAVAKGLEIFGTSALELVDAVRDGRLSVDEFVGGLVEGSDTIVGVADETDGWREKLDELRNNLKLLFEPAAREVFGAVTGFVDALIPAAQRVSDAYGEGGLQGALEQIAVEWDKIYDDYLEPLWLRFLDFLEFTVVPAALDIGGKIGRALGQAFQNGVGKYLEATAQATLDNPLSYLVPAARGIALGMRALGRGLQTEVDLGLGGERRIPIVDVVPDLPSGLEYGAGGLPSIPNPQQRRGGGSGLPPGVEFGSGGLPVIPAMAAGGIVTSPTLALIGEAGPEAVVPLRDGYGTTVNVTVTSADPEAVVDAIRRYTRSNGPLGQVVRV